MTYWAMNAVFLAVVAVVAALALVKRRRTPVRRRLPIAMALLLMLGATAVFDNIMIGVGLVAYDPARISKTFIGLAPLEDFAYTVAAVALLPSLWALLGRGPRASAVRPGGPTGTRSEEPVGIATSESTRAAAGSATGSATGEDAR